MRNLSTKTYKRRGVALMLVMITVLITGGMAIAYFGSRDNSILISQNVQKSTKARMTAESGVALAIAILETDFDWRTKHIEGVILDDFAFGDSRFSIKITDSDTKLPPNEESSTVELSIQSTVDGVNQEVLASAIVIPQDNKFDVDFSEFAVFAESEIKIQDFSTVKRWAASPGATTDKPVKLGTLSTRPLAIQSAQSLHSVEIHGPKDASSMLSSTRTEINNFSDTPKMLHAPIPDLKSATTLTQKSMTSMKSVKDNWQSRSTKSFTKSVMKNERPRQDLAIASGSYTLDKLQLTNGESMHISGDVELTIKYSFMIENADIILAEDATLTIFTESEVHIDSGYIGNANKSVQSWIDPSRIKLYSNKSNDWNVRGKSMIKGEIYAPKASYEMSEQSILCGRVAADEVYFSGASRVYYDQLLDQGGYANPDGILYNECGELVSELKQMNTLNREAIETLQNHYTSNENETNYWSGRNWKNTPTDRPNEVIYEFIAFGFDAREWESLACKQAQSHATTSIERRYD